MSAAYLFLIFLGGLGIHRFYMNQGGMGVLILGLSLGSFFLSATPLYPLSTVLFFVVAIILIVDLFTLAGDVRRRNAALIGQYWAK